MKRILKRSLLAVLLAALLLLLFVSFREPSLNRDWDEDVRVLASVDFPSDGTVALTQIRDWQYSVNAITSKSYFDASLDPNDIVAMWMYEQQLDATGLIAHTFVVFEFDERYGPARYLGLSVETRRELGEKYSIIGGALRSFEITHIWATEEDLVTRRVQFLDYPLTRYRLDIPADYRSRIFVKFAKETRSLASEPQWYNTATNNCTSSLVKYVNESEPGAIPLHYSYALTGRVDEYLEKLEYKAVDSSLLINRDFLKSNTLR